MKITKYIHSCLLIEEDGQRLLMDPGTFSFIEKKVAPEDFTNIHAILITHEHGDHVSPEAVKIISQRNPSAIVYVNSEKTAEIVRGAGIEAVEVFKEGERNVVGFHVRGVLAQHEAIPFPAPENTAYIINKKLLHPGDSYDPVLENHRMEILALPLTAPWGTWNDAIAFAIRQKPKIAIPIHDGFVKDFFLESRYAGTAKLLEKEGIEFKPLHQPGESVIY